MGEGSAEPPKMEPQDEEAKQKVRQDLWNKSETTMLPEAYELLEEDSEAVSDPGRVFPPKSNEKLIENAKDADENTLIGQSPQFSVLRAEKLDRESRSPIRLLRHHMHSGPHGGFYHDERGNDGVIDFKLWHLNYRTTTTHPDFPERHPFEKFRASETAILTEMAKLPPVYMGLKPKNYLSNRPQQRWKSTAVFFPLLATPYEPFVRGFLFRLLESCLE